MPLSRSYKNRKKSKSRNCSMMRRKNKMLLDQPQKKALKSKTMRMLLLSWKSKFKKCLQKTLRKRNSLNLLSFKRKNWKRLHKLIHNWLSQKLIKILKCTIFLSSQRSKSLFTCLMLVYLTHSLQEMLKETSWAWTRS